MLITFHHNEKQLGGWSLQVYANLISPVLTGVYGVFSKSAFPTSSEWYLDCVIGARRSSFNCAWDMEPELFGWIWLHTQCDWLSQRLPCDLPTVIDAYLALWAERSTLKLTLFLHGVFVTTTRKETMTQTQFWGFWWDCRPFKITLELFFFILSITHFDVEFWQLVLSLLFYHTWFQDSMTNKKKYIHFYWDTSEIIQYAPLFSRKYLLYLCYYIIIFFRCPEKCIHITLVQREPCW